MDEPNREAEEQSAGADIPTPVPPVGDGIEGAPQQGPPGGPAAESPGGDVSSSAPGEPGPDLTMAEAMAAESHSDKVNDGADVQMPADLQPIQPAEMVSLSPAEKAERKSANINLLMDVNLPVSIELGRTRMSISDILELGSGSIVELDKLAGEPVDILVNNKPLAKGEVVVVDENFGVRITSLVSPRERLERLKS